VAAYPRKPKKKERNYDTELRGFGFGLLWCLGLVFSTIAAAMLCFAFYGLFFLSNMYVNVVLTMFFITVPPSPTLPTSPYRSVNIIIRKVLCSSSCCNETYERERECVCV